MNEDHIERLIETGALAATNVMERWLKDEQRWRKVKFHVTDADKVELREMLVRWAKERRQV
jgi:hypothetical protein